LALRNRNWHGRYDGWGSSPSLVFKHLKLTKGNHIMFTIVITTWLTTLAVGMFGMAAGD
jgi:hypothetical protein